MSEELIKDLFTYGFTFFAGFMTSRIVAHLNEKNPKNEDEVSE